MGSVSFRIPGDLTPAERAAVGRAVVAGGYDLSPAPTRAATADGVLTLTRDAAESGYLAVPWPAPGGGVTHTLSATLRERPEPYDLCVELARGRVNQLRTQVAEWAAAGFTLDPAEAAALADVARRFGRAVLDAGPSAAGPRDVLDRAAALSDRLARRYAGALLDTRTAAGGPLDTRLGLRLGHLPAADARAAIAAAFTSVRLVPNWRAIEPVESAYDWRAFDALVDWAAGAGLDVSVGPVIDLADGPFPDWVRRWDGDLPSLAAFFCDFVESVVKRYQNRVRTWQVCAGFNHADRFSLGEDDRLRLAARLFDAARTVDPDAAAVLSLAQPWGDYLAAEDYTYSPLVFADTLVRAGFTFAAVDLEILHGPPVKSDRVTPARDAVSLYRLCELVGMLSLPLELTFGRSLATAAGPDLDAAVTMGLALTNVRAVFWEAWSDPECNRVDDAGLAADRPPAAALRKRLRDLRLRYLA